MRVQLVYGEDYTPREDEVLDTVCRILLENNFDLEQLSWSGLPIPRKRPRI